MSNEKNNKILLGSGLVLALTSSLCCIVPALAIISGTGSAVAAFSWAAPLRPYLLGATVLILGFAFYQAYKPKAKDECACETKRSFLQSKSFLWIVAAVSLLLSAFPYYAKYLQPQIPQQQAANHLPNQQQAVLHLQGMDCEACEGHVNNALLKKKGVQQVHTSYPQGTVTIQFDSTSISLQQLAGVIENETGYKVISPSPANNSREQNLIVCQILRYNCNLSLLVPTADIKKKKPCPPMHASISMYAKTATSACNPRRATAVCIAATGRLNARLFNREPAIAEEAVSPINRRILVENQKSCCNLQSIRIISVLLTVVCKK